MLINKIMVTFHGSCAIAAIKLLMAKLFFQFSTNIIRCNCFLVEGV